MATEVIVIPAEGSNPSIGGGVGSGTPGSVLFIDAAGLLAQNNANFFWNNTTNNLLLGASSTVVPSKLYINIGSATERGILIRSAPAQSASVQEFQEPNGAAYLTINPVQATNAYVNILAQNITHTPLKLWGYLTDGTFTADLMQWRDKDARVGKIDYRGALILPGASSTLGGQVLDFSCASFAGISGMRFSGTDAADNNILATSGRNLGLSTEDDVSKFIVFRTVSRRLATIGSVASLNDPTFTLFAQTSTAANREIASFDAIFSTSTDATRKGRATLNVYDTAKREAIRLDTDGTTPRLTLAKTSFGTPAALTIATGVVTITKSYHTIDTEASAASDDLDTISGGNDGDLLYIRAASAARTVVAKDGTGNLKLAGDFSLDNSEDMLHLIYDATLSAWLEVSRSDNGI